MNLQVLPLKVLVSGQVIKDRMDYTDYLAGKTRSEMDILDRFAGRFVVQASELIVERYSGGDEVPLDELEKWEEWQIPSSLMKLLHGSAEISIVETSSSGARTWVISDVDGLKKPFQLRSRGWMLRSDYWIHADDYIENGKLISARKMFVGAMGGKVDRDGPRWAKVWLWNTLTPSAWTRRAILSGSSSATFPSPISRLRKFCTILEYATFQSG